MLFNLGPCRRLIGIIEVVGGLQIELDPASAPRGPEMTERNTGRRYWLYLHIPGESMTDVGAMLGPRKQRPPPNDAKEMSQFGSLSRQSTRAHERNDNHLLGCRPELRH